MPTRILRDCTDSEAVNSLTDTAEKFFYRLIQKADDFGRYHGAAKLLRPMLYPLQLDRVREADIDRSIAECVKASLVRLYDSGGKPYLVINKFGQRQRSVVSKFPEPTKPVDGHVTVICPSSVSHPRPETETYPEAKAETVPRAPADVEIPSLEEATAYATSPQCGFPPGMVQRWLDTKQAQGWHKVADWRASMRASKSTYWQMQREQSGVESYQPQTQKPCLE